jgi:hypothetical protein
MARRAATIVRTVRAPAPVIRIAQPRAIAPRTPKRRGRRRSTVGAAAGGDPMRMALAAGLYGLAEKSGILDKLPAVPVIGKKGTAALVLWYWGRHGGGPWVRQGAVVAAVLAGYQLGREGTVSGDEYGDEGMGRVLASGDDEDVDGEDEDD